MSRLDQHIKAVHQKDPPAEKVSCVLYKYSLIQNSDNLDADIVQNIENINCLPYLQMVAVR